MRCRAGCEEAWRELVDRYRAYARVICTHGHGLSASEAEDVCQETFARAYANIHRIYDDGAIRPWIGQVTRRLAIEHRRRAGRTLVSDDVTTLAVDTGDDHSYALRDDALAVRDALHKLPAGRREVMHRYFLLDQSYRQIARELDVTEGTVASQIARGLQQLRAELEGRGCGVRRRRKVARRARLAA